MSTRIPRVLLLVIPVRWKFVVTGDAKLNSLMAEISIRVRTLHGFTPRQFFTKARVYTRVSDELGWLALEKR